MFLSSQRLVWPALIKLHLCPAASLPLYNKQTNTSKRTQMRTCTDKYAHRYNRVPFTLPKAHSHTQTHKTQTETRD